MALPPIPCMVSLWGWGPPELLPLSLLRVSVVSLVIFLSLYHLPSSSQTLPITFCWFKSLNVHHDGAPGQE